MIPFIPTTLILFLLMFPSSTSAQERDPFSSLIQPTKPVPASAPKPSDSAKSVANQSEPKLLAIGRIDGIAHAYIQINDLKYILKTGEEAKSYRILKIDSGFVILGHQETQTILRIDP
ncbi:MAG: hypothetical protein HQM12_11305 [SAR324 cluster bacterium]|nr:hypothetical protein [SAR324 cluster bacterium]